MIVLLFWGCSLFFRFWVLEVVGGECICSLPTILVLSFESVACGVAGVYPYWTERETHIFLGKGWGFMYFFIQTNGFFLVFAFLPW